MKTGVSAQEAKTAFLAETSEVLVLTQRIPTGKAYILKNPSGIYGKSIAFPTYTLVVSS